MGREDARSHQRSAESRQLDAASAITDQIILAHHRLFQSHNRLADSQGTGSPAALDALRHRHPHSPSLAREAVQSLPQHQGRSERSSCDQETEVKKSKTCTPAPAHDDWSSISENICSQARYILSQSVEGVLREYKEEKKGDS